ncbi:MAG: MBL fold metallo-hydrolase [Phycisphaerales bacterium]
MQDRARFAARATRSGLRRYPRQLVRSLDPRALREDEAGAAAAIGAGAAETTEALAGMTATPLAAAWLGHGSVMASVGGHRVLVDPVFSQRIGVRVGRVIVGKTRVQPAPVAAEQLAPADLLLLTHAHFDHLDRPTLARLAHPLTHVLTARHTARLVPAGFGSVRELHWGASADVGGLQVSAVRPAHWGARTVVDRRRGFNSYVVEAGGVRCLFAGDTAETDAFDALDPVDLAVFGIGAYDPWIHAHATPEQVWGMVRRLGARWLLPVHHSTFVLSDEPLDEPMERLRAAAAGAGAGAGTKMERSMDVDDDGAIAANGPRIMPPILGAVGQLD